MKILFVTGDVTANVAGTYYSLQQLANHLDRVPNVSVEVVGTSHSRSIDASQIWGIKTTGLPRLGPFSIHYVPSMRAWLNSISPPDIVVLNCYWQVSNITVVNWCIRHSIPYIISPRGCLNSFALSVSKWKKYIANSLYITKQLRYAEAIHCLTVEEEACVKNAAINTPTIVIPNGIDASLFQYYPKKRNGPKTFIFIGRLHPIKGIDILLHAFARLKQHHDWQLQIYGQEDYPNYGSQLVQLVDKLGIKSNVAFFPAIFGEEKFKAIHNADFFVLASRSEGFSMAVLEALLCGTPVIISEQCNFHQIESQRIGIISNCSVTDFSEALAEALNMTDVEIQHKSSRSVSYVKMNYSWETIAADFHTALCFLLDNYKSERKKKNRTTNV